MSYMFKIFSFTDYDVQIHASRYIQHGIGMLHDYLMLMMIYTNLRKRGVYPLLSGVICDSVI